MIPLQSTQHPTRVRYGVLSFLCVLAFIFYLDRVCMAQAGPKIQAEYQFTDVQMSYVYMAFTVAYGLFQVAVGRLSDRFGSRNVLIGIVIWWSIFTALTGLVTGLIALIIVRFLFGIGEAGAFPNTARIIARWFPADARSTPQGLINTFALIGGAVAPFVAAAAIDGFDNMFARIENRSWWMSGWRWSFFVFGALGVIWVIGFSIWYHDDPRTHSKVNQAERDLISRQSTSTHSAAPKSVPWNHVISSRNIWLMGFVISCASFVSYLFFTWYPTYLQKARGADNFTSGWMSAIVLAAGAIGSTMGGWMTDRLMRRTGERSMTRRVQAVIAMSIAGALVLSTIFIDSILFATIITALAFFFAMLQIAPWWGVVADISGRHVATLFGLMNSLGVIGALLSQYYFGWLGEYLSRYGYEGRAKYDPAFYGYAIALWLGAIGWCFIDANKSAVGRDHHDDGSTS